ncbi:unnamed protein product, partial [marine sediment metagenome]
MRTPASGGKSFTSRIAMWSARHRKAVAIGWVLIVVLALGACSAIEANTDVDQEAPGETGEAADIFEDRFGEEEDVLQEIVTFSHPSLTVDDPEYEDTVTGLMAELRALRTEDTEVVGGTTVVSSTRIVSGTTSHYDIRAPREASPFVAQNETGGDVTFALVKLEGELDEAMDNIDPVLDAVAEEGEASDGFEILIGGDASLNKQMNEIVGEDFG